MKKIIAIVAAAVGILWARGRRRTSGDSSSWAEGTDTV